MLRLFQCNLRTVFELQYIPPVEVAAVSIHAATHSCAAGCCRLRLLPPARRAGVQGYVVPSTSTGLILPASPSVWMGTRWPMPFQSATCAAWEGWGASGTVGEENLYKTHSVREQARDQRRCRQRQLGEGRQGTSHAPRARDSAARTFDLYTPSHCIAASAVWCMRGSPLLPPSFSSRACRGPGRWGGARRVVGQGASAAQRSAAQAGPQRNGGGGADGQMNAG